MNVYQELLGLNKAKKNATKVPVSERLDDDQVMNSAGGYVYPASIWTILDRFLVIGTEAGTYYVGKKELTKENAINVAKCLITDYKRAVDRIVQISNEGRAPSNSPALFAIAMASVHPDESARQYANSKLNSVARTHAHLLEFVSYRDAMGSWGRSFRNAVANWYLNKSADNMTYQIMKYRDRKNWSTGQVLAMAHPRPKNREQEIIFSWAVNGASDDWQIVDKMFTGTIGATGERKFAAKSRKVSTELTNSLEKIMAFERIKSTRDIPLVVELVRERGLPHECVPDQFRNEPEVWRALLETMPMTAMIRNLNKMTELGLFNDQSPELQKVINRLGDDAYLARSRVHPLNLFVASRQYALGRSGYNNNTWNPSPLIVQAMNKAIYKSMKYVEASGKKILVAIDMSGSMVSSVVNMGRNFKTSISCRDAATMMALAMVNSEPNISVIVFSSGDNGEPVPLHSGMDLESAILQCKRNHNGYGGTDCSIPFVYALNSSEVYDAIIVLTDHETWAGGHPSTLVDKYRRTRNSKLKVINIGFCANNFSIVPDVEKEPLNLHIAGLDSAIPQIVTEFLR